MSPKVVMASSGVTGAAVLPKASTRVARRSDAGEKGSCMTGKAQAISNGEFLVGKKADVKRMLMLMMTARKEVASL